MRIIAPKDIEEEGKVLVNKWFKESEGMSIEEYLDKYSSQKAKRYMKKLELWQKESEKRGARK